MKLPFTLIKIFAVFGLACMVVCSGNVGNDHFSGSLTAPLLTSAESLSSRSVGLYFRNNDLETASIQILRIEGTQEWQIVDSVPAGADTWIDSSCLPNTWYSYALLGIRDNVLSDTSNSIEVLTLEPDSMLYLPSLSVVWLDTAGICLVTVIGSSEAETGYYLQRRSPEGDWERIAEFISSVPSARDTIMYSDESAPKNTTVSYRATVFNDVEELSSHKQTVVTLVPVDPTGSYSFTRVCGFTVKSPAWIERAGDSVYFPEITGENSVRIAVVSVTDPENPRFVSYADPAALSGTTNSNRLMIRCRYQVDEQGALNRLSNASTRILSGCGYSFFTRGNMICQFDDSNRKVTDSVETTNAFPCLWTFVDSSTLLISDGEYFRMLDAAPGGLHFGAEIPFLVLNDGVYMRLNYARMYALGSIGDTIFGTTAVRWNGELTYTYQRLYYDRTHDTIVVAFDALGHGHENGYQNAYENPCTPVVDNSVVFTWIEKTLFAVDIRDVKQFTDYTSQSSFCLSSFTDQEFNGGTVLYTHLDKERQHLYLIGENEAAIYRYQRM